MSDEIPKAPTEVQPDLFPDLPRLPTISRQPEPDNSNRFDPLYPPGDEQFQKWDPLGAEKFHGPASD